LIENVRVAPTQTADPVLWRSVLMKKPDPNRIRILIADDQADVREALLLLFKSEGLQSQAVDSPERVIDLLRKEEFALVLMDLNYSRDTTSGQ
jgi:FixJ family two-component response regulator